MISESAITAINIFCAPVDSLNIASSINFSFFTGFCVLLQVSIWQLSVFLFNGAYPGIFTLSSLVRFDRMQFEMGLFRKIFRWGIVYALYPIFALT